jgi:DNA-binding transcriptional LysR family regulator
MDSRRVQRRVRLRDLETFAAVVRAGGMRKAASGLNLSQPAVSRAVRELEDAFGAPLLQRSRRGVEPTAFGQALMRRAGAVLDELASAVDELAHLADPARGTVRVGSGESIQAGLVSAMVQRLLASHPRMQIEIETAQAGALVEHYLRGRLVDFAIARPLKLPLPPDMQGEPLFFEHMRVGVGHEHPFARRRRLTLADLMDEHWILSHNELMDGSPLLRALQHAGLPPPARVVTSGSVQTRAVLLATGRFVTLFPHTLFPFGDWRQRIRVLPVELPAWQVPTMAITLLGREKGPATQLALELIREMSRALEKP